MGGGWTWEGGGIVCLWEVPLKGPAQFHQSEFNQSLLIDTEIVLICGYHPWGHKVFVCISLHTCAASACKTVPPRGPTCDARDATSLSRTVLFYLLPKSCTVTEEKVTVQINQGTKRMKPTPWFASSHLPTFRENHTCTA